MKITKPILLIILAAGLFASCRSNEVSEDKVSSQKEGESKLAEKAKEQQENTVEYLEDVEVPEVKYDWQKNLFWFIAQRITQ